MKEHWSFLRTTLIGGLLVLLPAYLTLLLVLRGVQTVFALVTPLAEHLPGGTAVARLLALALLIGVSFAVGLAVRTRIGQRVNQFLEVRLLERIPGYDLLRSLGRRLGGEDEGTRFAVALVVIEDALVPAFLVEEHADGSYTVFVPAVPTPTVGSVYVLPRERVHRLDVPLTTAVACITRWGAGTGELLQALERARSSTSASARPSGAPPGRGA
jgi:uncharacterized membrane protein